MSPDFWWWGKGGSNGSSESDGDEAAVVSGARVGVVGGGAEMGVCMAMRCLVMKS